MTNNNAANNDNISPSSLSSNEYEEGDETDEEVVGCEHYVRRCLLVAPCCDKAYVCRHCHNDAEAHEMDRHAVKGGVRGVYCAAARFPNMLQPQLRHPIRRLLLRRVQLF